MTFFLQITKDKMIWGNKFCVKCDKYYLDNKLLHTF